MDLKNESWITDTPITSAAERFKISILLEAAGFKFDVIGMEGRLKTPDSPYKGHIGFKAIMEKVHVLSAFESSRIHQRFMGMKGNIEHIVSIEILTAELVKIIKQNESI